MAKIMSQSNRIYYKTLSSQDARCITYDVHLFNCMVHDAYDKLYRMKYKNLQMDSLQTYLKETHQVNDYIPLFPI